MGAGAVTGSLGTGDVAGCRQTGRSSEEDGEDAGGGVGGAGGWGRRE